MRTRRDMETAAELRAAGANWETVAEQVRRHANVVMRWVRFFPEEWERLLQEAEERISRHVNNESRSMMRNLLRSKSTRLRRAAADKIARRRLEEKRTEPLPDPRTDLAAFEAHVEEMSNDELERYLADFMSNMRTEGAAVGVEGAAGAADPD